MFTSQGMHSTLEQRGDTLHADAEGLRFSLNGAHSRLVDAKGDPRWCYSRLLTASREFSS